MIDSDSSPQIGQFVLIKRGRDAGQYAIIVHIWDNRFVSVADGDKRKIDRPKKKNIQHLQCIDYVSTEVQSSIHEKGRISNGKLRFAMAKFIDQYVKEDEKGDEMNGER